ncbi:I17RC protein, partial [Horornis vulcanius]|nr:I17RC protein [Horornis vulcanius]
HPFPGASADAEAWERLWAQSRLVLHIEGQVLTCSLSAPCDLLAELVPCWQPVPSGPCQPLPGLQQAARGQGPQEFGRLWPHPNLCVQVWSGGQVRLTQCLRDREYCGPPGTFPGALPGRPDDVLLLEHGGNASLCAVEKGACTPLASFTSTVKGKGPPCPGSSGTGGTGTPVPGSCGTAVWAAVLLQGAGHPGLLEQDLQQDVAEGQCQQVSVSSQQAVGRDWAVSDMSLCPPQLWHPSNSTGVVLWACPLHKYLHTHWALVWMGVLLGAACLLLLLLMKKKDMKGEWCTSGSSAWPGTPPGTSLPLLPSGWLKSLRAGYGSKGE